MLFKKHLGEDFAVETYNHLFTFRCTKWINKLERVKAYYAKMDEHVPQDIYDYWDTAVARIQAVKEKYGDEIKPGDYKG